MKRLIWISSIILVLCTAAAAYFAFSTGWLPRDWVSLAFGVIIASVQVLLVYAWVEPQFNKLNEGRRIETWERATREFLATCVVTSHDVTRSIRHHLVRDTNEELVLLRSGIREALTDVTQKNSAFDMTMRLCSAGFGEEKLVELVEISHDLRAAADDCRNALNWLDRLDADKNFPHVEDLCSKELHAHVVPSRSVGRFADPVDRDRKWLVRDLSDVVSHVLEACVELKKFALREKQGKDGLAIKSKRALESSRTYARIERKATRFNESESLDKHIEDLEEFVAELERLYRAIDQRGICLVWREEEEEVKTT